MITNKVQEYRKEKGLRQYELAKILNVTRQTIIAIENNKFNPSLELSFRISNFFDRPIEEIFTYTKEEL
ncbi:helix-turn-helix transcriptional regulator [Paenibacillus donghaensis]|uniref:helix-turn-helix transcriptional regulator n=1 Tax=Paenibacillus donghaensis TaxID=414771 RepID=UPI001FE8699E|nr:helix-turn-helix transcriptional regulator [Paenibacillus donghaensis]